MTTPHSSSLPLVSRRTALRLGAGGMAASLATSSIRSTAAHEALLANQGDRATFVLVPGQWTGAFVWHTVAPLLRDAGHDVYAVTCTGLGDRVHLANPAIDLDTHIMDVVNVIDFEDLQDVILVGHSYAGMIITGVAERIPERLARLVYLDAAVPTDGQNTYDADYPKGVGAEILPADIAGGMAAGMPGFRPVFPEVQEWLRGAITDPVEAEWFISKLVPHPELSNLQPVMLGNVEAAAVPRTYILCTGDKDLTANPQTDPYVLAAERANLDPNWTVIEMEDTHLVNLNNPQGTAEALVSLVSI